MSNGTAAERASVLEPAARDAVARTLAVVALAGVALIHLLGLASLFVEASLVALAASVVSARATSKAPLPSLRFAEASFERSVP